MGDGVPDPVGGFGGAELVEDEDLRVEDGGEDLEFGGGDVAVVGVLDLFEEVAVVDEEAGGAALGEESLEDADGEVGFADADGAGEEQTAATGFDGVGLNEAAGVEVGGAEGAVGGGEVGDVLGEGAVLVAPGDVGGGEHAVGAALDAAGAGLREAVAVGLGDEAMAGAFAEWAGFGHGCSFQYGRVGGVGGWVNPIARCGNPT